jgi:hypothetical protein
VPRPVPHVPRSADPVEPSDPKEWINVLSEVPLLASLGSRCSMTGREPQRWSRKDR